MNISNNLKSAVKLALSIKIILLLLAGTNTGWLCCLTSCANNSQNIVETSTAQIIEMCCSEVNQSSHHALINEKGSTNDCCDTNGCDKSILEIASLPQKTRNNIAHFAPSHLNAHKFYNCFSNTFSTLKPPLSAKLSLIKLHISIPTTVLLT